MTNKKTTSKKRNRSSSQNQITGNIGLFYVCYELSRRGVNVVPTSRNTPAVDLFVANADFSKYRSVQVKAIHLGRSNSPEIGLRSKLKTKDDALKVASVADFWVNVLLKPDSTVSHVFVWNGSNKELIDKTDTHWLFKTNRKAEAEQKKWKPYKNNWQLIESALK